MAFLLTLIGCGFLVWKGLVATGPALPFYVAAGAYLLIGPIAYAIGDGVRRAVMPQSVFVSGGFWAVAQSRILWAFGPQGWVMIVAFLGLLLAADSYGKPATTPNTTADSNPKSTAESVVAGVDVPETATGEPAAESKVTAAASAPGIFGSTPPNFPPLEEGQSFEEYRRRLQQAGFSVIDGPTCYSDGYHCRYEVRHPADNNGSVSIHTAGPDYFVTHTEWHQPPSSKPSADDPPF